MSRRATMLPTMGYRPALDGVRGIALLLVFFFHAAVPFANGGFLGVDLFFVLSGFLITSILLADHEATGRINFKEFYARRARRLLPALLAMLAVVALYAEFIADAEEAARTWKGIIATLAYVANWVRAYGEASLGPVTHAWSLSIEEQFYLLWPPLLALLLWMRVPKRTVLMLTLVGIAASGMLRAEMWTGEASALRLYDGLDTRADALLIGCAAALLASMGYVPQTRNARRIAGVLAVGALGVLLIMSYSVLWRDRSMYFGLFTVAGLASGVLIYGVFGSPSSVLARALSVKPLVWMGRLSYSLYLWHAPIMRWVGTNKREWAGWDDLVLETTLTAVASVASYFLIEQPLRARVAARKPKLRVIPGDRRTRAPSGRPEIAAEAG